MSRDLYAGLVKRYNMIRPPQKNAPDSKNSIFEGKSDVPGWFNMAHAINDKSSSKNQSTPIL